MKTNSNSETVLRGIAASPGVAIGKVHPLVQDEPIITPRKIAPSEIRSELLKFEKALEETRDAIEASKERALSIAGMAVGKIFDAHMMILEDIVFQDEVKKRVEKEQFSVDFIANDILAHHIEAFEKQSEELFRERAADIRDVRNRLIRFLEGKGDILPENLAEPMILTAKDLSPTDTLHIDRRFIQGIVTDTGGLTSHTAILARSLEIPAVVGVSDLSRKIKPGETIILNGNSGKVLVHPTSETMEEYRAKQKRYESFKQTLDNLKDLPSQTTDGHKIELWGNIELPRESESVLAHGGTGIGLFRSEFLFLTRETIPSEDEQFAAYDKGAELIAPYPMIIRTFDLGGDKLHSSIHAVKEKNPFLGYRAIRVSLSRRDLFKQQLRAILRASHRGNVKIMFPLITGLEELRDAKSVVEEAKAELARLRLPHDEGIQIGAMIEVPSAVAIADLLAEECDFFSIGTNDLIQYALATDRGNDLVSGYYRSFHPSVMRMIGETIKAAHKARIPVGICGELGGNPIAAPLLIGLGVDEISTTPSSIAEIKKIVRSLSLSDCKKIASRVLRMETAAEIQSYLTGELKKRFADLPIWFS